MSPFFLVADILSNIRRCIGILQSLAARARLIFIICLAADHSGVIAAQMQRRHEQLNVLTLCHLL